MRLIYSSDLVSDPGLATVLEGLLEPLSRERLPAKDALALLRAPTEDVRQGCRLNRTAFTSAELFGHLSPIRAADAGTIAGMGSH